MKRFNLGLFPRRQGGNHKIASVTINLGSTKGRGSSTRIFNYCNQHSANPSECINQFINIQPTPTPTPTPTCDYTFTGTGELTEAIVNSSSIGTAQNICIVGYTSIGQSAFQNKTLITSVTLGNSVTSIGDGAFSFCTSLSSITIPDSVTSIGNNTFSFCTSLLSVTIGNSVTSIGDAAFSDCTSLSSITIGNSVTSIGDGAFYTCTALTSITIPDSVTSIGNSAFLNSGLTTVTISSATAIILGISGSPITFFGANNVVMTYT